MSIDWRTCTSRSCSGVLRRGLVTLVVALACSRNEKKPDSAQVVDTERGIAASATKSSTTRIEPDLVPAMARALERYAPGFQRFAATEYAPRVDTTYRADGDFNGDNVPDVALYGHDNNRELLLVLLSAPDSAYRVVPIEDRKLEPFQSGVYVYINTEPPGPLDIPSEFKKTLEPRPPERLAYAAINVLYGNEGGVLYYWNGKEFVKVITGD
jgi:hypothetical protein